MNTFPSTSFSHPGVQAALADVDNKGKLRSRAFRQPDYEAEHRALLQLADAMAEHPSDVLQKLIDITCEVCRAHTAGLSLLETHNGKELFRWEAVAGRYADCRNNTMPRNASPCGTTVDRNVTQLMYMAERVFPALKADPPVVEALLLPFRSTEKRLALSGWWPMTSPASLMQRTNVLLEPWRNLHLLHGKCGRLVTHLKPHV